MIGIQYDLVSTEAIYAGADWSKEFQFINPATSAPYDLSNFTVESKARKKYSDANEAWTFTCTFSDAANGTIKLAVDNATSANLTKGFYKYDVELTEPTPSTIKYKAIIPSLVQVVEEYTY